MSNEIRTETETEIESVNKNQDTEELNDKELEGIVGGTLPTPSSSLKTPSIM